MNWGGVCARIGSGGGSVLVLDWEMSVFRGGRI